MTNNIYTDEQLVCGIINNDRNIIEYFFYKKCSGLLSHILYSIFKGRIDQNEILHELFLYLAENNWHKLKQFDFRSKLTTWLGVVSIRFFQKKRDDMIENESSETLMESEVNNQSEKSIMSSTDIDDIHTAISMMRNDRYKTVIMHLDIQGDPPEYVAEMLGTSISNLYNIRHRAHQQLATILGRKEDWYD